MITSALSIDLANKIARALEARIKRAKDGASISADMERVERLHNNGKLSLSQYKACLVAAVENAKIPETVKEGLQGKLDNVAKVIQSTVEPGKRTELLPYNSHNIITPRSAIQPDEHASWHSIREDAARGFLQQISPIDGAIITSPGSTVCQIRPLPWFDDVDIMRVYDPQWAIADLVVYYLVHKGSLFRLNGTSPPIHDVNKKAGIKLTKDNALDYLRFFCFFVRGEEGAFYLLETMDDPFITSLIEKHPEEEAKLAEHASPLAPPQVDDEGFFLCKATVFYSNAIFKADMKIHPTGMVEMLDDEPVAADLAIRIVAPVGYSEKKQA